MIGIILLRGREIHSTLPYRVLYSIKWFRIRNITHKPSINTTTDMLASYCQLARGDFLPLYISRNPALTIKRDNKDDAYKAK